MENGLLIGSARNSGDNAVVKFVTAQSGQKTKENSGSGKQGNSFFVGNLCGGQNAVSDRFARAQNRAIKRILDQFAEDSKIDEDMKACNARAEEYAKGARDSLHKLNELDGRREELMKEHEIDPDSQEQKDLELMQKANAAAKNPFDESLKLTPEEEQRLAEMPPLTDYQEAMLLCDTEEEQLRGILSESRKNVQIENATVHATQKALLKARPGMLDAMAEADEIMKNALKEQMKDILKEGADKVDEDRAENQEQMEEAKEKALEEKIRREKLNREEAKKEAQDQELQETVLSAEAQALASGQQMSQNLQANIKSLIQDQIVLDVDLKGLRMDKQL